MIKKVILFISLFVTQNSFTLESALYPEDGSMEMNYWYYSGGRSGPRMADTVINNIEQAFLNEGVTPVIFPNYSWMQDILFFDQKGNFVQQANFAPSVEYFGDVTMGVFEMFGNDSGELTKLYDEDFITFDKKSTYLTDTFLEGGATITGKFKDGADYIILTQARVNGMAAAYRDRHISQASNKEILEVIAKDLNLKVENMFILDAKIGSEHLDLYMKALPGGVILLDDPSERVKAVSLVLAPNSEKLKNIKEYEEGERYGFHKKHYKKKIQLVKNILEERFEVHMVSGRFFEIYTTDWGGSFKREYFNFFNGVSGINKNGQSFYITNMAKDAKGLETHWTNILSNFGFESSHIYYPGEYSNGSGLDCMGSPSL
ncbi:hypothetical protein A9Q84_14230 [Halobacteriovorax marinus]|uniref:Uncharacterized protein n=1 Tax=Halobacteriovorax marinus TaxID=97084 RepID=A0A1Y5F8Q8_9BACT|nr:hypothetical protein A9Q84_14230 [Halobacteriovorax marinus]